MSIVKEFREFAVKGNVVDMAVGIIIGGAFGKIVSSLVSDVITPPLGYLIGGVGATFDFIIVAAAIFLLVKMITRLRRAEEAKPAEPPAPPRQELLLEEIRDLLKRQR